MRVHPQQQEMQQEDHDSDSLGLRIALSHVPLQNMLYSKRLVLDIGFDYIISGHIHHENYASHLVRDVPTHGEKIRQMTHKVLQVTHEITVPTCSYRMGEAYPGVGAMVIGKDRFLVTFSFSLWC